MVELSRVLKQLSKVGYRAKLWQRAEVKELCKVLHEDEHILQATNGYYEGGFSLLVATDHRILLVDRKPMFLTLDSIAYYMIQEVTFNYRLFNSTIHIFTSNKCLDFNSWNHSQIRAILSLTQDAMRQDNINPNMTTNVAENYKSPFLEKTEKINSIKQISTPDSEIEDIPTMPIPNNVPHFLNDNTESSYDKRHMLGALSIEANNVSLNPSKKGFKPQAFVQRQYARRIY